MKDIPVLFTNDDILVVNKPCGLAVQGGTGISITVIDILERQTGSKIYPVHRLDKDTAGILVVARSPGAAARYSRYIAEKSLAKYYQAVCFGIPEKKEGIIRLSAGRTGNERPAETSYRIKSTANNCSLIELKLGTGRMHQIRIHLASINCPIIADDKYGNFKKNKEIRSRFGIRKLQLAAFRLSLPIHGSDYSPVSAELPKNACFAVSLPEHMLECIKILNIPYST